MTSEVNSAVRGDATLKDIQIVLGIAILIFAGLRVVLFLTPSPGVMVESVITAVSGYSVAASTVSVSSGL